LAKIGLPRYPVTDYLFYRKNKNKKAFMRIDVKDVECRYHLEIMCGVLITDNIGKDISLFRCRQLYRDKKDLFASVYAELVASYFMVGSDVVPRKQVHYGVYMKFYERYYTAKSSVPIRGPTNHLNPYQETTVYPAPFLRPIVKEISEMYMHETTRTLGVVKGSLADRCAAIVSWERYIYEPFSYCMNFSGGYDGETFNRCVFSTNTMDSAKQVKMMKEFSNDTADRGPSFQRFRKYIPQGLKFLEKALDVDYAVGKSYFKYDPVQMLSFVKMTTGGGIFPMRTGVGEHAGFTTKFHNSGKKVFMFEVTFRYFHRWMMGVLSGKYEPLVDIEVIRQKQEWKKYEGCSMQELSELYQKLREFFIPSPTVSYLGEYLYKDRRLLERGSVIRIGINFFSWWGL